ALAPDIYMDNGSGRWDQNGFVYGVFLDIPNACYEYYKALTNQTIEMIFYTKWLVDGDTSWANKFRMAFQKQQVSGGLVMSTDVMSAQTNAMLRVLNDPGTATLN